MPPTIAVIHATRVAMAPVEETFGRLWPEAETFNLLDESLIRELEKTQKLTQGMFDRIAHLAHTGKEGGADAILYSCSAFGAPIEAVQASLHLPVLKPNEAMIEEALEIGGTIRLTATFEPSIPSMVKEFEEMAEKMGKSVEIDRCHVPGALEALRAGDPERHNELIALTVAERPPCDVVALAQFSMAEALPKVAQRVDATVLSCPDSAVRKLQKSLANGNHLSLENQLQLEMQP